MTYLPCFFIIGRCVKRPVGRCRCRCRCAGFTLIEATMSLLIIGLIFVTAMNLLASSQIQQKSISDSQQGQLLCQQLMAEIEQQIYWDPAALAGMGPGSSEAATGNRSLYDDVDDYHNWTASPPQQQDGTALSGYSNWTRKVVVNWVSPDSPDTAVGSESGIKRVIVTAIHFNKPVASLQTLISNTASKLN